jgi:hypothetical protein
MDRETKHKRDQQKRKDDQREVDPAMRFVVVGIRFSHG